MKSMVAVKQKAIVREGVVYKELSKGVVISVALMSATIGAWGVLSILSAFSQLGFSEVIKGFFQATTGM